MSHRHVIVHYHIFKNAGTTLAGALARNFGKEFASIDSPQHGRRLPPDELIAFLNANPHVAAISSHDLRPPAPALAGTTIHELLLLRHPVDRIRSMCDFYRRSPVNQDPLTKEAKHVSVSMFLQFVIDNMPNLITNAQLNLVANGGAKIPEQDDLDRAANVIGSMCGIGVVEEANIFAVTAECFLQQFFPGLSLSHNRENVSRGRAHRLNARLRHFSTVCGGKIYHKLVSLNQLDAKLVELAGAEARRRFQEVPLAETRLREFRKRMFRSELDSRIDRGRRRIERLWQWTTGHKSSLRRLGT
jgi:hypothetical protein